MSERASASPLPWFGADRIAELVPMRAAIDVLEQVLAGGFDPSADPPRSVVDVSRGQLLLMPSEASPYVGIKIATVAPGNSALGRPRIQAVYVLMGAATLTPCALLDGLALTSLRTPAVSAVAARYVAEPGAARLVVFGSGPQAVGHIEAIRAVRPITDVVIVGRDRAKAQELADHLYARVGSVDDVDAADIIVCATTATEALFDGARPRPDACVIAVGSHEPHARELDGTLLRRATVVVEDRATALREAGDVIRAIADGEIDAGDLIPLADVVTGRASVSSGAPRVFKSVGMAWQDLAIAAEVFRGAG